jgi:hypothetical protein
MSRPLPTSRRLFRVSRLGNPCRSHVFGRARTSRAQASRFLTCSFVVCWARGLAGARESSVLAQSWPHAVQQQRLMRLDMLRQQHHAAVEQLQWQLRATHLRDLAGKRAILECMIDNNRRYHEQVLSVVSGTGPVRHEFPWGYRTWSGPVQVVIPASGTQGVIRQVSPVPSVVRVAPTAPPVRSDRSVTAPQTVTPPMALQPRITSQVAPAAPSPLTPVPDPRPSQPAVVPAGNLEPLPIESLPTPRRAGEPTPAKRPPSR